MATITKNQLGARQFGASRTVYGNVLALPFALTTDAAGALEEADSTEAVAAGDVVKIGVLPGGMRLDDAKVAIKTAMTASVTGDLGFAYVDGEDDAAVPQDSDYFAAGVSLAAAAVLRMATPVAPVTLPKDAWLILTTGGAANDQASEIHVTVYGEQLGLA